MKNLIKIYTQVFIGFFTVISVSLVTMGFLFHHYVQAGENDPLDHLEGVAKFEVSVGIDNDYGRYYTYHYEFTE